MSSHATNPIGVIGAGTMGTGIAQAAAAAGWSVRLCDIEQTLIEQAESNIVKRFERLVEKRRITNEQSIEFFNIIRKLQACRDTFGNTNMTMVIAPGQICDKFFGDIKLDN